MVTPEILCKWLTKNNANLHDFCVIPVQHNILFFLHRVLHDRRQLSHRLISNLLLEK